MKRINCEKGVHDYNKLSNKSVKTVTNARGETEHIPLLTEIMVCGYCGHTLRPFEDQAIALVEEQGKV